MTAFVNLAGVVFQNTTLRCCGTDVKGILKQVKPTSIPGFNPEIIDPDVRAFEFRCVEPSSTTVVIGDSVIVTLTDSSLINVGNVLKCLGKKESVVKLVNQLVGEKLYLISSKYLRHV